jgi:hypothetical protein
MTFTKALSLLVQAAKATTAEMATARKLSSITS